MTKLKVLSHACLHVSTEQTSIIIDPWLVGTCYWRSWSNYPPASFDKSDIENVSSVIITHIHWDHWHGPTLKKFFRNKSVIVPKQPNPRCTNDLKSIGIKNITELAHNRSVKIGDIQIFLYQFGLYLQDSAVIIKTPDITILNANDAKLAGRSLEHLKAVHGPFDFAFRSHSSANNRICFEVEGDSRFTLDDREHYFRSFQLFMDKVNPRFAIPFASNHTHINFDSAELYKYVSNPLELEEFLIDAEKSWALKTMLPGSSWNSESGFEFFGRQYFENFEKYHEEVRLSTKATIEKYQSLESKLMLGDNFSKRLQKFLGNSLSDTTKKNLYFIATSPCGREEVFYYDGRQVFYNQSELIERDDAIKIVIPNIVLRDAVLKNMFHHAGISKRVRYVAKNRYQLTQLQRIVAQLEKYELTGGLGAKFYLPLIFSYAHKWREALTYVYAGVMMRFYKVPLYKIEEIVLKGR
ncbi:MBL fold metallo-hydrolase [Luminiphilus sp.]|nr:MBL fold metallo-hydrolase [Luminiphilus sp.]